ncbi:Fic family protein [Faunimonas pinastri]|uniref:Fic family protein n=1 Tax=Faunimonas pinastri TaxID=1855383 RepID=A0A1H9H2B9_9HYPH|nr:Fic family protein [Faunimonas pinastri]SEQ56413.1 Fic family protein [Faunimonas pinastri]
MVYVDQIQLPQDIQFSPETLNLLDEVQSAIAEISSIRPFDPEVNSRISTEFLPDRVTASLNIEGISVSRRQTLLMMDAMTLSENSSKAEQEVYNALKADEFVFDLALSGQSLTSSAVREINRILQDRVLKTAGTYRQQNVEITGAAFQPPDHTSVPQLISDLVDAYCSIGNVHPVLKAAWLHASFTHIHPFEDGNGRTGRLLQDLSLLYDGYYPTGIPSHRRDDYYDALECADSGDWNQICQMICEFELTVLSKVQAIYNEVRSRGEFITALAKRAKETRTGALHKQYVVWKQRMHNFTNQIVATCDDVNRSSDILFVRTDQHEIIDFPTWQEISEKGRRSKTWVLNQTWFSEGQPFYKSILYFRRHEFRPDDVFSRDQLYGKVSLFLTGGEPEDGYRFDFNRFADRDIRFRELLLVDGGLHVFRSTRKFRVGRFGEEEIWQCDDELDSSKVVQEIVEDIFRRKLGL